WVDDELDPSEARQIAELARSSPEAQALAGNLRGLRDLVRQHPPERTVDASRDFYWSRIRQGIEKASATAARQSPAAASSAAGAFPVRWLAWLIPSAAIAAVALFALAPEPARTTPGQSQTPVLVGHVVESPLPEMNTLTFYSSRDAMTVVWVGEADIL
ncbi:MAG: hypothetical protein AB7O66_21070, partial [Limisphaerales bacterium]